MPASRSDILRFGDKNSLMSTFRRILSYARPYGRYWPGYLVLSILSVVFGIANYALIGPVLGVLFEPPADGKATIYLTGTMKATPPEVKRGSVLSPEGKYTTVELCSIGGRAGGCGGRGLSPLR